MAKIKTDLVLRNHDGSKEERVVVKEPVISTGTLLKGLGVIGIGVAYLIRSAFKKGVGAGLKAETETLGRLGIMGPVSDKDESLEDIV